MSRTFLVGMMMILVFVFALASQAIVRVKTVELSFQLSREQLFNYELSSQMLRARFSSLLLQKDDYSTEVKMNVLESGVLNFSEANHKIDIGAREIAGLWIVNGVRRLALKPTMALQEDQARLDELQFAFFMERQRNFKKAAELYAKLEPRLTNSPGDHSFALLHQGYCLALLGSTDEAIRSLKKIIELYPSSRNADDAKLLIEILEESRKRSAEIDKKQLTPAQKAVALYLAGQYARSLRLFNKAGVPNLTLLQRYYRARALERTGRTKTAIQQYIALVKQKKNPDVAKKANRRLLMIGNFYMPKGGNAVKKIAEENAKKIGDTEAVKEINTGVKLVLKSKVVEKIEKQAKAAKEGKKTNLSQEQLEKLAQLRREMEATFNQQEKVVATIVKKEKPVIAAVPKPKPKPKPKPAPPLKPPGILVRFLDGRTIYGGFVDSDGIFVTVRPNRYGFGIKLPYTMVAEIQVDGRARTATRPLAFELRDGTVKYGTQMRRDGEYISINDGLEEVKYPVDYFVKAYPFVK